MRLANENFLEEAVEIDETLVGGRNGNRHWDKKVPHSQGRSHKDKAPVVGMIQRENLMNARVTPDTKANTLSAFIREFVHPNAIIYKSSKAKTKRGFKMLLAEALPLLIDSKNGLIKKPELSPANLGGFNSILKQL